MSVSYTPNTETGSSSRKVIRARFNKFHTAFLSVEKACAVLAADKYNFIEVTTSGVNLQAGPGNPIAIQTMGYHGPFHLKAQFPLTLLPGPFSPPDTIEVPLMSLLPKLPQMVMALSALASLG